MTNLTLMDRVDKVKNNILSSNENIAILVLSVILVCLAVYYFFIKKKESYNNQGKLVLFHVGWCGHCKNFKPKWDTLPKTIEDGNNSVDVVDEKCEDGNEDAPKKYGVSVEGFPSVFLISGDKKHEYDGAREPQSIIDWVKSKLQ